jgi:hypothetical protein
MDNKGGEVHNGQVSAGSSMSERAASKERGAQGLDLSPIRKRYHGCLAEVDQMEFYCRLQQCVADIPALLAEVDRLRTQGSAPSGVTGDIETATLALRKAAVWFREYERIHAAKGPEHALKTARNRERAEYCEHIAKTCGTPERTVRAALRGGDTPAPSGPDGEYAERANVVALAVALADRLGYEVGALNDPAEPDWPVVYIGLPTGQVSWHFSRDDFTRCFPHGLHRFNDSWDGHDTATKYARCAEFVDTPHHRVPAPSGERERLRPRQQGDGSTHWEGCWEARGHHDCAVAMIQRLRATRATPQEGELDADMAARSEAWFEVVRTCQSLGFRGFGAEAENDDQSGTEILCEWLRRALRSSPATEDK